VHRHFGNDNGRYFSHSQTTITAINGAFPAPLHYLMKPLFWAIAIASLTVYFSGCASINEWVAKMEERTYNRYANQALVRWYRNQFLPKMNELRKNSSYGMYVVERVIT